MLLLLLSSLMSMQAATTGSGMPMNSIRKWSASLILLFVPRLKML